MDRKRRPQCKQYFVDHALRNTSYFSYIHTVSSSSYRAGFWSAAHFLGHLQARQPLSTVRENSNYDIIRAGTGTYKAEDPEGTSRRISAGEKDRRDFAAESVSPPITMKQDKQSLESAIRL